MQKMEKTYIDAAYFAKVQGIGGLKESPCGKVLFTTKKARLKQNNYSTNLWMYSENKVQKLSCPKNLQGYWWQNPNTLLLASGGGKAQRALAKKGLPTTVFATCAPLPKSPQTPLCHTHMQVQNAWPLPCGGLLVLAVFCPMVEKALKKAKNCPQKAAKLLKKWQARSVFKELPFCEDGQGFTQGERQRLFLWRQNSWTALTGKKTQVEDATLCKNGKTVYVIAKTYTSVAPVENQLFAIDLATQKTTELSFAKMRHDVCLALPDGGLFVAGSDMALHGLNQNPAFYRLDKNGEVKTLYSGGQYGICPSVLSDVNLPDEARPFAEGENVYFVSTIGSSAHLMQINAQTGKIATITKKDGMVSQAVPTKNGGIIVCAMWGQKPQELYRINKDGRTEQITHFNSVNALTMAKMQPLKIKNGKRQIDGWVMLPPKISAKKSPGKGQKTAKIPAILYIHGGPKAVFGTVFFHEMQFWAQLGYAVLLCNPRGSDGKGDAFADIRGLYGKDDCQDLLLFCDAALKKHPCIDPARLCAVGGSYGGFMVNWLLGQTQRFAAAISTRGIANWFSMAAMSDIGYFFVPDQTALNIFKDASQLLASSPLSHAGKAKTPTLFLHSGQDHRCPPAESMQMYTALKLAGVPARLVVFCNESHAMSRSGSPQNRILRLKEMAKWLKKYSF